LMSGDVIACCPDVRTLCSNVILLGMGTTFNDDQPSRG